MGGCWEEGTLGGCVRRGKCERERGPWQDRAMGRIGDEETSQGGERKVRYDEEQAAELEVHGG